MCCGQVPLLHAGLLDRLMACLQTYGQRAKVVIQVTRMVHRCAENHPEAFVGDTRWAGVLSANLAAFPGNKGLEHVTALALKAIHRQP